MEGSTATKLKVRRVDGCPLPGSIRIFVGEVDVLESHRIQQHPHTTGTIVTVVGQNETRREKPEGGTVVPVRWYSEIGPGGFIEFNRATWDWARADDAPARTPTVTVTR